MFESYLEMPLSEHEGQYILSLCCIQTQCWNSLRTRNGQEHLCHSLEDHSNRYELRSELEYEQVHSDHFAVGGKLILFRPILKNFYYHNTFFITVIFLLSLRIFYYGKYLIKAWTDPWANSILEHPAPTKIRVLLAISLYFLHLQRKSGWEKARPSFSKISHEKHRNDALNSFGILDDWQFYFIQFENFNCSTNSKAGHKIKILKMSDAICDLWNGVDFGVGGEIASPATWCHMTVYWKPTLSN